MKLAYLLFLVALVGMSVQLAAQQPVEVAVPPAGDVQTLGTIDQTPALAIARAYGFDRWGNVERIDFTFNVERDGKLATRRAWVWWPQENRVRLGSGVDAKSYDRSDLNKPQTPKWMVDVDKQFINDSYWLLFPFHVVWSGAKVEEAGVKPLPMGEGEASKIIVSYPKALGGYSPGDAYDLYLDRDTGRIRQWVFRRGGAAPDAKGGGRAMSWEGERQLGPIIISTQHRSEDDKMRLYFDGLKLKVEGEDEVLTPRALEEAEEEAGE